MTFKPGDKVRCIDNHGNKYITVGETYTVTRYNPNGGRGCGWLDLKEKPTNGPFYPERFEKVKEVNTNKHGVNLDAIKPGDTVTITAVVGDGMNFRASSNVPIVDAYANYDGKHSLGVINPDLITAHTPKPREVKPGQVYVSKRTGNRFEIVAIHKGRVVYECNGTLSRTSMSEFTNTAIYDLVTDV